MVQIAIDTAESPDFHVHHIDQFINRDGEVYCTHASTTHSPRNQLLKCNILIASVGILVATVTSTCMEGTPLTLPANKNPGTRTHTHTHTHIHTLSNVDAANKLT